MNTASHNDTDDTQSMMPLARIDAQDETYVLPLREFLESHGVEVTVNSAPAASSLYHIVAGDATYVKQIFSRGPERGTKRLGIVLGGGKKQEEFSGNYKIITASPVPLTNTEVNDVFTFFFTEGKNHLDLRRFHETRTVHELGIKKETDDARVNALIADVFKDEATRESRKLKEEKKRNARRFGAWMLGALMGLGILIIPTAWYAISMMVGGIAVASGARALRQGNYSEVVWDTRIANYWIHQGSFVLGAVTVPFSWAGWEDDLRGQQRLVSFLQDTLDAEEQTDSLTTVAVRVAAGLLNQVNATSTGTTAASDISTLRISLYALGNTLGLAQAELQQLLSDGTFPFSISFFAGKGRGAVSDLASIRESSANIDELLSLFLSLAGFKQPSTYLILLQNSMELRPTGGFIGSVALASFADGRLTNLDVEDVYTYDGQLKGHVDPPVPIRDMLGQEHWYLRDSNWDPDFKEAGARAAWFYEKETGQSVDGVIGVSTPFITDLLKATGPITLPDYHDTVTADNFYGKSIYYTQNDFFPGSTQKKDFLGSLSRAMLTTITSGKNINSTELFRAITTALGSHDLLMMFNDSDLQSLVEHYGWAGRVPPDVGCTGTDTASCIFDPFISNEANLGVNKVNYFVSRSLARTITIHEDGTRTESMALAFHNSAGAADGNLPYSVYDRFELPVNSSVDSITFNGAPVPELKVATTSATLPYVERTDVVSGAFTVGVAFDVPPGSDRTLNVTYTEHEPLSFSVSGAVLDDFVGKQPGVSGESVKTVIQYPNAWTVGVEDNNFIAKPGQLEYNTVLDRDALTRIRFTK